MSHLIISKNEVHLQIESDMHVYYELADYFTFEVLVQSLCQLIEISIGTER